MELVRHDVTVRVPVGKAGSPRLERHLPIVAEVRLRCSPSVAWQDDVVVMQRRGSLYKQFVRTGGVLWANPGALLEVRPIKGAVETIKPEAETWPGYMGALTLDRGHAVC